MMQQAGSRETDGYTSCKKLFIGSFVNMTAVILINTVAAVVDGIFISSCLGVDATSAFGLASPLLFFFRILPEIFGSGLQTVYGKYLGKGDIDRANACFSITMVFILVIVAAAVLICSVFSDQIAFLLGVKGKAGYLKPMLAAYIAGTLPGLLFYVVNAVISSLLFLEGDRRRVVYSTIAITIADIIGDWLVVNVFHTGLYGMAVTTSVSYVFGFLVLCTHFLGKNSNIAFTKRNLQLSDEGEILSQGLQRGLSSFSNMLKVLLLNYIILAIGGPFGVAVFAVVNSISGTLYASSVGMGQAAQLLTAVFAGEEDRTSCRNIMKVCYSSGLVINTVLAVIVFVFSKGIVSLYTKDPSLLSAAAVAVSLEALTVPFCGLIIVHRSFYQVTGHMVFARCIVVIQNLVSRCSVLLVFGMLFGFTPMFWFGLVVAEALSLCFIYGWVWIKNRRMPKNLEDIMLLPQDFGPKEEDMLRMNIADVNGSEQASIRTGAFCKEKGGSRIDSYRLSLFVEEMTNNILAFGYSDSRTVKEIEVLVVKKADGFILRIKDNAVPFNPVKWLAMHRVDKIDPGKNIGIRIVSNMAKDIRYVRLFNFNTLIIKV